MRKAIHFLERRWNLSHGKAICGLDCDGVSDKFAYGSDKISQWRHNADLLHEGNTIWMRSKIDAPFQQVAGHMDDHYHYNDLTREQQLNTEVDGMAKAHLRLIITNATPNPTFAGSHIWQCTINGKEVTSSAANDIRALVYKEPMKAHLHKKGKLAAQHFDLVDWDATGRAMDTKPTLLQMWASKHASGFCGTGKMMHTFGYQQHS